MAVSRRRFLKSTAGSMSGLLLTAGCTAFEGRASKAKRPNVVFVIADQWRACDTGFAVEPRQSVSAVWDDQVALSAYHLPDFVPGKRARIVLWWRTLRQTDRNYSAFVHLLNAHGAKISQFDKLPLSDFYPMRVWPQNADQRDTYPIKVPEDADLDGAYLAIGLYDRHTGQRLPVSQDNIPIGDLFRLPLE